ncbi:MAG: MFS transporter [Acidimicrobiia bacterium]|nr:MFS transporter [Acidimicrobiia bacterium]
MFAGLFLMLTGAGLFNTLLGVRAQLDGFAPGVIGAISAAYYAGFLLGSRLALRALGRVGHIRVYAALASVLAAAIIGAGLAPVPAVWLALRFTTGLCLAGQYVVAESWLNQLVSNRARGRVLAVYGIVTVGAFGAGQLVMAPLDPEALTGFAIAALLITVAVAPVALSEEADPPAIVAPERMSLGELWRHVPTGVVTSVLVGIAHGSFFGLTAYYAARSGLDVAAVALFVAAPTIGCVLFQFPISAASDDVDRRAVGALAALTAAGGAVALLLTGPGGWAGVAWMVVMGGTMYPLYSIAGAYTTDWLPPAKMTAAASQLVLLYGAGALLGPLTASAAMGAIGPDGYVWTAIVTNGIIAIYLVVRMASYRLPLRSKPWRDVSLAGRVFYVPATVVHMGRRLRDRR